MEGREEMKRYEGMETNEVRRGASKGWEEKRGKYEHVKFQGVFWASFIHFATARTWEAGMVDGATASLLVGIHVRLVK